MEWGSYIALDLGHACGWASMSPSDNAPRFGTWQLPRTGPNLGAYLAAFDRLLRPVVTSGVVREIVYEAPIMGGSNGQFSVRKQMALGSFAEYLGDIHGIRVREKASSSVRKHFIGTARAPKHETDGKPKGTGSKWLKEQVARRCRQMGWNVETFDEADALALLDYTLAQDRGRATLEGVSR